MSAEAQFTQPRKDEHRQKIHIGSKTYWVTCQLKTRSHKAEHREQKKYTLDPNVLGGTWRRSKEIAMVQYANPCQAYP